MPHSRRSGRVRVAAERLEARQLLAAGPYLWPVGAEIRANSYTTSTQSDVSAAIDANGNFVLAWTSSGDQDGSLDGVYAQRYNSIAAPLGSEFRVNSFTTGGQRHAAVAMDPAGDFVVVWESGRDGSGDGVYAQRYNALGAPQGAEFRVNTYTTNEQYLPSVAMDDNGNFVVAWASYAQEAGSFSSYGIYAQRYNAAGTAQGGEFHVNIFTSNGQSRPSVAMDAAGNFLVTWQSFIQEGVVFGTGYGIYGRRYTAAGVAQGTEFLVNAFTTGDQRFPSAAMDASGNFVVTWQDEGVFGADGQDGAGPGIRARRFNSSGAAQGGEFGVNSYTTGAQATPSAAMNSSGECAITWESNAQDGSGYGVYARRYDAAGAAQGNEFRVNSFTSGDQRSSAAVIGANGDLILAWSGAGASDDAGVYARAYATFGPATAATVGDRVWNDTNGNGIQDPGENGISGAAVELDNAAGAVVANAVTDASGHYSFTALAGATVSLHFSLVSGFTFTLANHGSDDEFDSDADRGTGTTAALVVGTAGTSNNSVDAGLTLPASITGVVFFDRDGDASIGTVEERLSGFEIFLDFDNDGFPDANEPLTASNSNGGYAFVNLLAGTYRVVVIDQDAWTEPVIPPLTITGPGAIPLNLPVRTNAHDTTSVQQGTEFSVSPVPGHQTQLVERPAVAMDDNGDAVVAWSTYLPTGGGLWGVYVQRYNAAGAAQGSAFRISAPSGLKRGASVAMDANGNFVVAWTSSYGQDGSADGVYAQRFNAAGVLQGSEFRVNTYTTSSQTLGQVAMDPAGDFVVVWNSYGQDGSNAGIYAQRYNALGTPQGGEIPINSYTTGSQTSPSVTMDAAGNFVVTWNGAGAGDDEGVYARRYSAAGVAQGAAFSVNTVTSGSQINPRVAADSAGEFVVAWNSFGEDGPLSAIEVRRYNAAGIAQGAPFRVNTFTTNNQSGTTVAMNGAGDFLVSWQTYGQDGDGTGVFAQRYNLAGVPQGGEFRVNGVTTNNQSDPAVAFDAAGRCLVVWTNSATRRIAAQKYATLIRPAVTASQIVWQNAPQRIEFTFDQDVSASLASADLVLENLSTSTTIPTSSILTSWNPSTRTGTFAFPALSNGGSLPDGNYRATLLSAGISNTAGTTLVADRAFSFFALAGDTNHDHSVDVSDLGILATNWQGTGKNFSEGDFNYDGMVDVSDLGILATNWQKSLPPASSATQALSGGTRSPTAGTAPPFNPVSLPRRSDRATLVSDVGLVT
jgi:hypothetical protein